MYSVSLREFFCCLESVMQTVEHPSASSLVLETVVLLDLDLAGLAIRLSTNTRLNLAAWADHF